MTERRCKTCESFKWVDGKKGECRHSPPTPFMLGIPAGSSVLGPGGSPGQMGLRVVHPAAWPAVQEDHWCSTGYSSKDDAKPVDSSE